MGRIERAVHASKHRVVILASLLVGCASPAMSGGSQPTADTAEPVSQPTDSSQPGAQAATAQAEASEVLGEGQEEAPEPAPSEPETVERLDLSTMEAETPECFRPASWRKPTAEERRELLALADHSIWQEDAGPEPYDCQLEVQSSCAPDIDGDGSAEKLVRFEWRMPTGDLVDKDCGQINPNDPRLWRYSRGMLVSVAGAQPEVMGLVGGEVGDGQSDHRATVIGFVRLEDGRVGVVERIRSEAHGLECSQVEARRLYTLSGEELSLVATEELACD